MARPARSKDNYKKNVYLPAVVKRHYHDLAADTGQKLSNVLRVVIMRDYRKRTAGEPETSIEHLLKAGPEGEQVPHQVTIPNAVYDYYVGLARENGRPLARLLRGIIMADWVKATAGEQ